MKLLITGDWHLRFRRPELRIDESYFDTQLNKINQILDIAKNNKCDYILQPGDFFDSVDVPWSVVETYIDIFKDYNIPIYCVMGQHDMRFHKIKLDNTPLAVMESAEVLTVLIDDYGIIGIKDIDLYGCNYGEEIPKIMDKNKTNILLIHKMIIDQKIWEGQTDFTYANHLSRKGFDLCVCGDNHKNFKIKNVINCGSLMRSRIDQVDHKPIVYIYDTEFIGSPKEEIVKEILLDIKSTNEIFDLNKVDEVKERDERLEAFVDTLDSIGDEDFGLKFIDNLYMTLDKVENNSGIKDVIEEALS